MCRMYGFLATESTRLDCSLVLAQNALQTQSDRDRRGVRNADGWGIAHWDDSHPAVLKSTHPAFADKHFAETAGEISSQAVIAHTGDSRAYVLRNNTLSLWTKDHTLMEERLALNLMTPDQVRTHPLRHVLTKALGIDSQALPTVQTYTLEPTDLLLLCSDGLTKMLTDQEIQALLLKDTPNLDRICHTLVSTANQLGGEDNTTVVVIGADSDATLVDLPAATE